MFSSACGVSEATWTRTAAITAGLSDTDFVAAAFTRQAGWADYGRVTINSGANAGARREVRSHGADGLIELWEPFAAPLVVGDTVSITAGCDKRLATCRDRLANGASFRSLPHLPGTDATCRYPDAR
ncbi:phage BR0599 family protein [Falsiroseomonas sp.]|uniref:phage BR0599 family protein n=1 Tax=Falsiroseomonas sp. TaxID=2870721 RepID=UPI0035669627